jgi:hypothetical protein
VQLRQVNSAGCAFGLWCGGLCNFGITFGVRRRPCLVDYNGSHLECPTAPSHGGAVTFLGYSQAVAASPRQFPRKRRTDQSDSKIPEGLMGASVAVLGRAVLGSDMRLYRESKCRGESAVAMSRCSTGKQRDGVHWACLEDSEGSNGDLVWLGLSSLTLAVACMSSGHSRHRVAGI